MNIRSATENDADALLSIYSYYVENTAATLEITTPTVDEFRNRIITILSLFPYLVIEENGKIIGYCYASKFRVREGYKYSVETSVYVKNGFQNKGYGKILMNRLEAELVNLGIRNINVCIVCFDSENKSNNNSSMEFHRKLGFSYVGKFHKCAYKFDNWYDVVWMEKHIGPHN